ncbi:MAG: GAF domain-containing protein [Candidatus Zixiibacteriota bacterium]|nr:MAG: GAF domain-containing protein [candidate division Zixibacteria bacterium]
MKNSDPGKAKNKTVDGNRAEDFRFLSHQIMEFGNRGIPKVEFLHEILKIIQKFSGCDAVELWLEETDHYFHCGINRKSDFSINYEAVSKKDYGDGKSAPLFKESTVLNELRVDIFRQQYDKALDFFTDNGSFWTGNLRSDMDQVMVSKENMDNRFSGIDDYVNSMAIIPLVVGDDCIGLLQFMCCRKDYFTEYEIEHFEITAETIGVTFVNERAQAALRERVKELTCLYSIAQVVDRKGISLEGILRGITDLLPPAWQYPEITAGRIILDGQIYSTPGSQSEKHKQHADIIVNGRLRGRIEVAYLEEKPDLDEGPFLKEERSLIDAIARQVALIVERREADEEKSRLQDQLRHADRLATLGQLSAGVAHEINEPLGSVLGFAQLLKKNPGLSKQALKDISKIEDASLHAREVVKKLMLFGRQMPPQKTAINLNKLIEEGLYFLRSRCKKSGIKIDLQLDQKLPEISADQSQIYQVLVNLAVNAMQAMPEGGELTIRTELKNSYVSLTVKDTGIGMDEETKKKIFMPFFTTKDIGEGTGIGLSVVHGIVTSHGGKISFQSELNKGSSFEVRLPVKEISR